MCSQIKKLHCSVPPLGVSSAVSAGERVPHGKRQKLDWRPTIVDDMLLPLANGTKAMKNKYNASIAERLKAS